MVLALRPATVSFPSTRLFRPRYFQVQFLCVPESLRVMSTIRYPEIRRDDLVENLHGVKVPDPYRWLEDPKCEDTRQFVNEQNALCEDYISKFPHAEAYRESLTNTYNYEKYGVPFRSGNHWYYAYNEGLRPQKVYYSIEGDNIDTTDKGTVFFDPNTLSDDGTLALNTHSFSRDGTLYAYALSRSGSDWCHAKIRRVSTGQDYPETLLWLKFTGLSFTNDNRGLLYRRYPEPVGVDDAGTETGVNGNSMADLYDVYYHVLGTDQSEDVLIYTDPEHPDWGCSAYVTVDGNWVIMTVTNGTDPVNKLWIAKLDGHSLPTNGKLEWIKIKDDFNTGLFFISNNENVFYFQSNDGSPKGKVVRYDLNKPEEGFVTIIPEQKQAVLEDVSLANEKYLLLQYLHNVQHKLIVVPLDSLEGKHLNGDSKYANGTLVNGDSTSSHGHMGDSRLAEADDDWIDLPEAQEIDLPVGSSVYSTSCKKNDPRIFIHCVGYTLAGRIYQYKFRTNQSSQANGTFHLSNGSSVDSEPKAYGKLSIWRESILKGFEPDRWTVDQVWVPNPRDGVKVPMFIVRDKCLVQTGDSFCLLYGYGGFNVSLTPVFSPTMAAMLTHTGGLYCVANIRGGGEFGQNWHKAAVREKRSIAFSDFEECARYLIREGWTRKEKLVCQGGSNGGALVGAVMNRTGEELFAAGIAQVGVLDLLRYHRFTIGYAWKPDYGDPDVKDDFEFIYKWSPYHNVRDGNNYQYPAILCETSDHDDRVVPLHSFKFIAALQHAAGKTNRAPLLLRHHLKAGHGAGKPTKKIIEEASERFAFMMRATGTTFISNTKKP